jgi:cytochrome c peroxidase
MKSRTLTFLTAACALAACGQPSDVPERQPAKATPSSAPPTAEAERGRVNPRLLRRFKVVANQKAPPQSTAAQVDLGRMLWFDARLSKGGDISCNSCHTLSSYGVDGRKTSLGFGEQRGRRNAPTVYNAAEHFVMFWDGRARDVEEQATGPILNPAEMAMTEDGVLSVLRGVPGYVDRFQQAFPGDADPINLKNIGRAIGAFERGLTTRSRWDDYLAGNEAALTPEEVQGLLVFLNVGCMGCHTGPQVGASMYQTAGFVEPWPNQSDLGRFEITKNPTDRMVFKVPSLKNIAKTGPFFHDGSAQTLPEAVRIMGQRQLGIELSDGEVGSIVAFLGALTGEIPERYTAEPELPVGAKAESAKRRMPF